MKPADPPMQQRRAHGMVVENIAIAARQRGIACMEIVRHLARPAHGDAVRQVGIHPAHPGALRPGSRGVEMHNLRRRMHPGIGAPGTRNPYRRAGDVSQRPFQRILDGIALRLGLPAGEGGAFVLQSQRDSHEAAPIKATPAKVSPARTAKSASPNGDACKRNLTGSPSATLPCRYSRQCLGRGLLDVLHHQHQAYGHATTVQPQPGQRQVNPCSPATRPSMPVICKRTARVASTKTSASSARHRGAIPPGSKDCPVRAGGKHRG